MNKTYKKQHTCIKNHSTCITGYEYVYLFVVYYSRMLLSTMWQAVAGKVLFIFWFTKTVCQQSNVMPCMQGMYYNIYINNIPVDGFCK